MSTKEALREYVDGLTEDDAERLWALIRLDQLDYANAPALTPEQMASINKGLQELREGKGIPHEQVLRRVSRHFA